MIKRRDVPPAGGPLSPELRSRLGYAVAVLLFLALAALPSVAAPGALGVPVLIADGDDGSVPLEITSLEIRVTVRGHLSRTEYEVRFRNDGERELRGEFFFPLPHGADVTDLALDVDGSLRHASSVEREVAKRAFEDVVHGARRDPILAEWREGSGFRYEIFPIPPNAERTVLIAYDRELQLGRDGGAYELAVRAPDARPSCFRIAVDADFDSVIDLDLPRGGERAIGSLELDASRDPVAAVVRVRQPARILQEALVEQSAEDGLDYVSFPLGRPARLPRHRPAMRIIVFWDASASARLQDRDAVSRYLAEFLARQADQPRVDIVPFHLWPEKPLVLRDRSAAGVRRLLDGIPSIGGTDITRLLHELPSYVNERDFGTRIVVVTDGLHDAGTMRSALEAASRLSAGSAVIDVVTAAPGSHQPLLESIAAAGRGRLVMLEGLNPADAADSAMFLDGNVEISAPGGELEDLTPGSAVPLTIEPFVSVCGRSRLTPGSIEIASALAGSGERRRVRFASREVADGRGLVRAAWARSRLKALLRAADANRDEMVSLGRRFGLLTPHTSLIVLERWRDYVVNDIPMPAEVRLAMEEEQRVDAAALRFRVDAERSLFEQNREVRPGDWILNGTVLHEGTPLPGVSVYLDGAPLRLFTVTNSAGRFWFAHRLRPSSFILRAEMEGLTAVTRHYPEGVPGGGNVALSMQLSSVAEAITVTAASPAFVPASQLPRRTGSATRIESSSAPCALCDRLLDELVREHGYEEVRRSDAETELRPLVIDAVLDEMRGAGVAAGIDTYLEVRERLGSSRRLVLTVAAIVEARDRRMAVRIVTELLERDADDAPFLRILAQLLIGFDEAELAQGVLERALELAPDEPQSWRDAIVLAARLGDVSRVFELRSGWESGANDRTRDRRFPEVEDRLAEELSRWDSLTASEQRAGAEIEVMPAARIQGVLRWDSNYAYVDLHVCEAAASTISWQNEDSADGEGHIRGTGTEGYGPQVYWNSEPRDGKYDFAVEYWSQDTTEGDLETIAHLALFKPDWRGRLVREDHIAVLYQDDDHISVAAIDVQSGWWRNRRGAR